MDREYRLVTYEGDGGCARAGILVAGNVHDASQVFDTPHSVLEILADWDGAQERISASLTNDRLGEGRPLGEVRLLAPVQYPTNFYCAGANYWDHLREMGDFVKQATGKAPSMEKAAEPWLFVKTTRGTIVGEGHAVALPPFSNAIDWEAELGVVIGRETKNISEADALSAVAGYLIINDLSARDLVKRDGSPFIYDWIGQKCWDGAAPMGPWLTPAHLVEDAGKLEIKLWVNDQLKQNSNSSQMVHSIAEQIAYLSRHVTLYPGDIIATGTPAGVGMPRQEFLHAGDVVKVEIESLGTLTHSMVAA